MSFYNVHNDKTSFSATLFGFAKQWARKVKPICKHLDKSNMYGFSKSAFDGIMLSPNWHMKNSSDSRKM